MTFQTAILIYLRFLFLLSEMSYKDDRNIIDYTQNVAADTFGIRDRLY
jgi:hypothetical protein